MRGQDRVDHKRPATARSCHAGLGCVGEEGAPWLQAGEERREDAAAEGQVDTRPLSFGDVKHPGPVGPGEISYHFEQSTQPLVVIIFEVFA